MAAARPPPAREANAADVERFLAARTASVEHSARLNVPFLPRALRSLEAAFRLVSTTWVEDAGPASLCDYLLEWRAREHRRELVAGQGLALQQWASFVESSRPELPDTLPVGPHKEAPCVARSALKALKVLQSLPTLVRDDASRTAGVLAADSIAEAVRHCLRCTATYYVQCVYEHGLDGRDSVSRLWEWLGRPETVPPRAEPHSADTARALLQNEICAAGQCATVLQSVCAWPVLPFIGDALAAEAVEMLTIAGMPPTVEASSLFSVGLNLSAESPHASHQLFSVGWASPRWPECLAGLARDIMTRRAPIEAARLSSARLVELFQTSPHDCSAEDCVRVSQFWDARGELDTSRAALLARSVLPHLVPRCGTSLSELPTALRVALEEVMVESGRGIDWLVHATETASTDWDLLVHDSLKSAAASLCLQQVCRHWRALHPPVLLQRLKQAWFTLLAILARGRPKVLALPDDATTGPEIFHWAVEFVASKVWHVSGPAVSRLLETRVVGGFTADRPRESSASQGELVARCRRLLELLSHAPSQSVGLGGPVTAPSVVSALAFALDELRRFPEAPLAFLIQESVKASVDLAARGVSAHAVLRRCAMLDGELTFQTLPPASVASLLEQAVSNDEALAVLLAPMASQAPPKADPPTDAESSHTGTTHATPLPVDRVSELACVWEGLAGHGEWTVGFVATAWVCVGLDCVARSVSRLASPELREALSGLVDQAFAALSMERPVEAMNLVLSRRPHTAPDAMMLGYCCSCLSRSPALCQRVKIHWDVLTQELCSFPSPGPSGIGLLSTWDWLDPLDVYWEGDDEILIPTQRAWQVDAVPRLFGAGIAPASLKGLTRICLPTSLSPLHSIAWAVADGFPVPVEESAPTAAAVFSSSMSKEDSPASAVSSCLVAGIAQLAVASSTTPINTARMLAQFVASSASVSGSARCFAGKALLGLLQRATHTELCKWLLDEWDDSACDLRPNVRTRVMARASSVIEPLVALCSQYRAPERCHGQSLLCTALSALEIMAAALNCLVGELGLEHACLDAAMWVQRESSRGPAWFLQTVFHSSPQSAVRALSVMRELCGRPWVLFKCSREGSSEWQDLPAMLASLAFDPSVKLPVQSSMLRCISSLVDTASRASLAGAERDRLITTLGKYGDSPTGLLGELVAPCAVVCRIVFESQASEGVLLADAAALLDGFAPEVVKRAVGALHSPQWLTAAVEVVRSLLQWLPSFDRSLVLLAGDHVQWLWRFAEVLPPLEALWETKCAQPLSESQQIIVCVASMMHSAFVDLPVTVADDSRWHGLIELCLGLTGVPNYTQRREAAKARRLDDGADVTSYFLSEMGRRVGALQLVSCFATFASRALLAPTPPSVICSLGWTARFVFSAIDERDFLRGNPSDELLDALQAISARCADLCSSAPVPDGSLLVGCAETLAATTVFACLRYSDETRIRRLALTSAGACIGALQQLWLPADDGSTVVLPPRASDLEEPLRLGPSTRCLFDHSPVDAVCGCIRRVVHACPPVLDVLSKDTSNPLGCMFSLVRSGKAPLSQRCVLLEAIGSVIDTAPPAAAERMIAIAVQEHVFEALDMTLQAAFLARHGLPGAIVHALSSCRCIASSCRYGADCFLNRASLHRTSQAQARKLLHVPVRGHQPRKGALGTPTAGANGCLLEAVLACVVTGVDRSVPRGASQRAHDGDGHAQVMGTVAQAACGVLGAVLQGSGRAQQFVATRIGKLLPCWLALQRLLGVAGDEGGCTSMAALLQALALGLSVPPDIDSDSLSDALVSVRLRDGTRWLSLIAEVVEQAPAHPGSAGWAELERSAWQMIAGLGCHRTSAIAVASKGALVGRAKELELLTDPSEPRRSVFMAATPEAAASAALAVLRAGSHSIQSVIKGLSVASEL
jgi:hypothetical protein